MRSILSLILIAAFEGCTGRVDSPSPPAGGAIAIAIEHKPAWGDLDGNAGGCGTDTLPVHPDARGLVAEYLTRDTAGTRGDGGWDNGVATCVDMVTGDDRVAVVSGFRELSS